ncbi:MAG: PEP-CTERM sorting domain-containing protein [Aquabacterium sp.]|uniref:PEP-CTERM sorting domain-containing protein n=1 Tax=Aquabacterium sp. TaxID=1872578 RepID=UPI00271B2F11|nr:PEP-CTERM sorting domain-containing protein [Aquabacterium sp.]MDO9002024.1 PEP-CTERM sorting domain-containing protein [Aquabacterium sp.]
MAFASAHAAVTPQSSYTYDFKTFYDTSTAFNPFDTKTLSYSVASMTIKDISGGVEISLTQNSSLFPAKTTAGTYLDGLWLNGDWGTVATKPGVVGNVSASGGGTFLGLPTIFRDGGYVYNGSIGFAGNGIAEGKTSVFTIKASGVSAYDFAKSSNVPMIELTNVGGAYNTFLSGGKVSFVGTIAAQIPEPSTYALMGLGLAGVAFVSRRARRAA